jgi:hypothetical protein
MQRPHLARHFHSASKRFATGRDIAATPHLDATAVLDHCAAMNGLNQICGICREIIR